MNTNTVNNPAARICLLSARQVRNHVTDAQLYEFEDLLCKLDGVDLLTYSKAPDLPRRIYTLANRVTRSNHLANLVKPNFYSPQVLSQSYDLFFVCFRNIFEIFAVDSIKNWRQRCHKAVCYIEEAWEDQCSHDYKFLLEPLKQFDHIFLGKRSSLRAIANYTNRPCTYLSTAIDTLKFCPYPLSPTRHIDVTSIGRRSNVTHQALLNSADRGDIFYYYDTAYNLHIHNPAQHRFMLANLLKRTRYFIVNYPKVDEPISDAANEIAARFYEGSATGTVMIGQPPFGNLFEQLFDWTDAVISMPFDEPNIHTLLAELDAQPDRLAQIRQNNVVNALLKHDWLYRWQTILKTIGLEFTEPMRLRAAQLQNLSTMFRSNNSASVNSLQS